MVHDIYSKKYRPFEIVSLGFEAFKDNFKQISIISLVIFFIVNLIDVLTGSIFLKNSLDFSPIVFVANFISSFIGLFGIAAISYIVKNYVDGKKTNCKEAFIFAKTKIVTLILTIIIMILFLFGLSLLLIIPGIIFGIYWFFTIYAVIFDDKENKDAMDFSKSLVWEKWWKTLGTLFIFGFIVFLLIIPFAIIFGIFVYFFPGIVTYVIGNTLISAVASINIVFTTLFYLNRKAILIQE